MLQRLKTIVESIAAALLIAAVMLNFFNVIGRYAFGHPIIVTEEILQYTDVWIVMLAAAAVTAQTAHLRMDVLLPLLSPGLHRILELAIAVLGVVVTGYVLVQGVRIVEATYAVGQRSVTAEIPLVLIYFAIPVGFACMILFLIRRIVRLLRGSVVAADAADNPTA